MNSNWLAEWGPIKFLIDYMMHPILAMFHGVGHNWGLAIVLLTISVKLILHPLTAKAIRSSLTMQKLAPQLKEIQEKYKNNPERLKDEMMDFYKKFQFNPLAGCLPILLQLPFFIALYSMLLSTSFAKEVAGTTFLGISSLTHMGVIDNATKQVNLDIIVMIVLFGLTTFLSQRIITKMDDPMQKQMLYMMPFIITIMFALFPIVAGALLYMVVSNTVTIFQYIYLKKTFPAYEVAMEKRRERMATMMQSYEEKKKNSKESEKSK